MDHGRRRDQLELPGSRGPRLAVSGDEEAQRLTKTQDRTNRTRAVVQERFETFTAWLVIFRQAENVVCWIMARWKV